MNTLITYLFCALIALPLSVEDITKELEGHFKTGNYKEISAYFGPNVDMKIIDKEDVYSKSQAELILKSFFAKNPPKAFSIVHNGISKNGAKFAIGSLQTSKGNFKTYILLKKEANTYYIQQLRIETED